MISMQLLTFHVPVIQIYAYCRSYRAIQAFSSLSPNRICSLRQILRHTAYIRRPHVTDDILYLRVTAETLPHVL